MLQGLEAPNDDDIFAPKEEANAIVQVFPHQHLKLSTISQKERRSLL